MKLAAIIFFLYLLQDSILGETFENRYKNAKDSTEECRSDSKKLPRLFQQIHIPWNELVNSTMSPQGLNLISLYYGARVTVRDVRLLMEAGVDALMSLAEEVEDEPVLEEEIWKVTENIKGLFEEVVTSVEVIMEEVGEIGRISEELAVQIPSEIIEDVVFLKLGIKYKNLLDEYNSKFAALTSAVANFAEKIASLPGEYMAFSDGALSSVLPEIIRSITQVIKPLRTLLSPLSPESTQERMPKTFRSYERQHELATETYDNAATFLLELSLDVLTGLDGYEGDYQECDEEAYNKMIAYLAEETEKVEPFHLAITITLEVLVKNLFAALQTEFMNHGVSKNLAEQLSRVVAEFEGQSHAILFLNVLADDVKDVLHTTRKLAQDRGPDSVLHILEQYWNMYQLDCDGLRVVITEMDHVLSRTRKTISQLTEGSESHDRIQLLFATWVDRFRSELKVVVMEASMELHSMMVRIAKNLFDNLGEHGKHAVDYLKRDFADYPNAELLQNLTEISEDFLSKLDFEVSGKIYGKNGGNPDWEPRKLADEHVWELRARYLKVTGVMEQFQEDVRDLIQKRMTEGASKDRYLAKPIICNPSAVSSYVVIFQKLFLNVTQINNIQLGQSGIQSLKQLLFKT